MVRLRVWDLQRVGYMINSPTEKLEIRSPPPNPTP